MRGVLELTGATMKGLVLGDRLGGSSHTAVYRARARGGRELAVKIVDSELEPETGLWERLRRDAGLLSEIGHPDILPIQEAGRSEGLTFAATPLLRAPSLLDLMGRGQMDNESAW